MSEIDDFYECKSCGDSYLLRDGCDPTDDCDTCAQTMLSDVIAQIQAAHAILNSKEVAWTSHPGPWRERRDKWNEEVKGILKGN